MYESKTEIQQAERGRYQRRVVVASPGPASEVRENQTPSCAHQPHTHPTYQSYLHPYRYTDPIPDAVSNTDSHEYAYSHPDPHQYSPSYCHSDTHAHTNRHGDPDANRATHTQQHADSQSRANLPSPTKAIQHSAAKADPNASASVHWQDRPWVHPLWGLCWRDRPGQTRKRSSLPWGGRWRLV